MTNRLLKRVLIADDSVFICNDLREKFLAHNRDPAGVFTFDVDVSTTIGDAIDKIRWRDVDHQYDVLVLDLAFDEQGNNRDGFRLADALGLYRRLGQAIPVEIVFSAFASLRVCVETMRCGAWDVIDKEEPLDSEPNDHTPFDGVVESAVSRLRALDLQQLLNRVALGWLQENVSELQAKYGGMVIAIWNEPDIHVVAAGRDVFALETEVSLWRRGRPEWMYPFVVQIPEAIVESPVPGV